jgi:hypothetical protein
MGKRTSSKNKKSQDKKIVLHRLNWLEYVAIGFSLWFVFYPKPYEWLLVILLIIPILGVFINGLGKPSIASLVEIDRESKNEYDVADFIDFPAFAVMIRVLKDYELDSYSSVLTAGSIAFCLVLLFIYFTHQQITESSKDKLWIYSSVIFCIFVYSFSAVISINCAFDNSKPKVYETKIIDKHVHRGRKGSKSYYVKVQPWGHHYDAENIQVTLSEYDQYAIDDSVKIDYKKGVLGIPWYYLE